MIIDQHKYVVKFSIKQTTILSAGLTKNALIPTVLC